MIFKPQYYCDSLISKMIFYTNNINIISLILDNILKIILVYYIKKRVFKLIDCSLHEHAGEIT